MIRTLIAALQTALRILAYVLSFPLRVGESVLHHFGCAVGLRDGQPSIPPPPEATDPGPSVEEIAANMREMAAFLRAICAHKAARRPYVLPPQLRPELGPWIAELSEGEAGRIAVARTRDVVRHLAGEQFLRAVPPVLDAAGVARWRRSFLADDAPHRRVIEDEEPGNDIRPSLT